MEKYFAKLIKDKLYLITRDIQVGDKYLTAPDYQKERVCEDASYSFEHCVKVIGEISPEAVWVKEGDEFEEEDIQKGGGYILFFYEGMTHWSKIKDDDAKFVKLKCPTCFTYH